MNVNFECPLQFPMISEFGEERMLCCSCEPIMKDTSVIQSETTNLQQRINSLTQEVRSLLFTNPQHLDQFWRCC